MTASRNPEDAARMTVANFLTEYIPGVESEYAMLEQCSDEPLSISLPEFQMETLIFCLHCLDRAVFACWGDEYRVAFMNSAFSFASETIANALPSPERDRFLDGFGEYCNARHLEYAVMKETLPYDFSKRLCLSAGVYDPTVQMVLMEGAAGIMKMMLKVAEDL